MKKYVPPIAIFLFIAPAFLALACSEHTTLRGTAQETKDGIYVDGVLIREEKLPKGTTVGEIVGKKIEVQGVLGHAADEAPKSGVQTQRREGEYQYMKKVESVKILK